MAAHRQGIPHFLFQEHYLLLYTIRLKLPQRFPDDAKQIFVYNYREETTIIKKDR
jgi:hypothetical protein